jgi:hypothetical protein
LAQRVACCTKAVLGSQATGATSYTAFAINNKIRTFMAGAQALGLGKKQGRSALAYSDGAPPSRRSNGESHVPSAPEARQEEAAAHAEGKEDAQAAEEARERHGAFPQARQVSDLAIAHRRFAFALRAGGPAGAVAKDRS